MEREVGGGIGMGNTCKSLAVSFQCMTKSTTNKKKIKKKNGLGIKKQITHIQAACFSHMYIVHLSNSGY